MSNFNQYFKNKGAQIMVERFFSYGIDDYSSNKLTDLKWHLAEEPSEPASYYVENGLTATHKVVLEYTINYDDVVRYSEFEVPREIDGVFIIEGAFRIATNTLGNDYDCRINLAGKKRYINFDYDHQYDIDKQILKIRRNNPLLGFSERVKEYPYDAIDEVSGLEKEALRLTDRQVKKLQIKLDLDYKPEYITRKLIQDCIAFGDDWIKDLIIDKKIESVPAGFMDFIFNGGNRKNFYGTKKKIRNYWTNQGKLMEPEKGGIKVLTMLCAKFWKGSSTKSEGEQDIQISTGINAINIESITNKITVPLSVAYNSTFSDLICVGATPNNQNMNKQNALTVSTHVTDEDVLFDVMTPNFEPITIPYLDYLNKKVCASEFVDYDNNVIKPNEKGEVMVKYRMKKIMVPADEVELVDKHPDYRLSEEVRQIPFVNYSDSVRIHMGSSIVLMCSKNYKNCRKVRKQIGSIDWMKTARAYKSFQCSTTIPITR